MTSSRSTPLGRDKDVFWVLVGLSRAGTHHQGRSRRGRTDGVKGEVSTSGPSRPEPSKDAKGDVIATVTVEVHGVKVA